MAPLASATRISTGRVKNITNVSQKPALTSSPAAVTGAATSSRPFLGSGTKKYTATAAMMPITPSAMKAVRQLKAAAMEAPNATPSAMPMGGPKLNSASAVPRRPGGK